MRIHVYFISGTIAVVVVSLGTMSFIRKILRRHSNRVTNGERSVEELSAESLTRNESVDTVSTEAARTESAHTVSTQDESCHDTSSEITHRNDDCRRKRRKLASLLRRKGKKEVKLDRRQVEILQFDEEIKEVMRMLKHIEVKEIALDEEIHFKKLELISVFPLVTEDARKEIRRKETIYHKRYSNIKTTTDAKNLLRTIRTKKHILDQLELLTYRKYVSIQHDVEAKDTPALPPLNPCRQNFDYIFNTIRDRYALQQQPGRDLYADIGMSRDDFPSIPDSRPSATYTHNDTLQLRMGPTQATAHESIV
ncbi:uncharacterized protein LOC110462507 [Mizuhopecten yessoensis]|uniref:uncharacterized protein LOC110462507 n=1 Tax=Mizuhopecten yessoensis TaxID=6573 RepID=UPI000B45AC8B|nr:uncharacterized protein LOC110462507 [Mizuhopecten yessoensis]